MAAPPPGVAVPRGARSRWLGLALAITASLIPLAGSADTAAANDQGRELIAMCASCHRLDGRDRAITPIAGLSEDQLTRAMLAYKSGERPSHIMQAVALSLSDKEIASIAHFLAARRN
jgi:cytochrome subunit of sulfide dehydrogenase